MLGALNPLRLPGASSLKGYLRPSRGLTLSTTLHGSGAASPPAVTMSGAGLSKTQNIELDMPVGGARGTAEFRWRQWGGAWSSNILTAASVDLSATAIGVTLAFDVGTYDTAHVYRSVVSTLVGTHGHTWLGESAATSVLPFVGTLNGRPSLRFDGVGRRFSSPNGTIAADLIAGEDTPFTILFVGQYRGSLTPAEFAPALSLCKGSAGDPGFFQFGVTTGGAWLCGKRGDTGGTDNDSAGTADNDPHVFEIFHTGTAVSLLIDGATVINAAAQNVSTIAAGVVMAVMLGGSSLAGTPPEFYGDWDMGDVCCYAALRSAIERGYVRQNLKNAWGL